jgi:CNP1-like family
MRNTVFIIFVFIANAAFADAEKPYDYEEKVWVELPTALPEYPKDENLIEFPVGPTERNRFFVDGSTISIGNDGIVRFVMVLKTSGGATNVTLEAMRCATREFKLFAVGRSDASWDKIDSPQWRLIENKTINHYRAVLSRDFLCPSSHAPRDATDARAALRRGKHPDAT